MKDKINQALEALRPAVRADGGNVELEGVEQDGTVVVRLTGFCGCCHATAWTHRLRIERALKGLLPGTRIAVLLGAAACSTEVEPVS